MRMNLESRGWAIGSLARFRDTGIFPQPLEIRALLRTPDDYRECHICGQWMEEKDIKQGLWIKGKLIVIEELPAGVCPQRGEKWQLTGGLLRPKAA